MTNYHLPKSEIVYLWINQYKNIKKQGFSFAGDLDFMFNVEEKKLTIKRAPFLQLSNCSPPFWGEKISSLSSIVGANGAGKTNILEFLSQILSFPRSFELNEKDKNIEYIIVFRFLSYGEEGKEFSIKVETNWERQIDIKNQTRIPIINSDYPSAEFNFINYVIYQSSNLDFRRDSPSLLGEYSSDISTGGLISTDSRIRSNLSPIEAFRLNSFQRQIELLAYEEMQNFSSLFNKFVPLKISISMLDILPVSAKKQISKKGVPENDFGIHFKDLAQVCNYFFGISNEDNNEKSLWDIAVESLKKDITSNYNSKPEVKERKTKILRKHGFLRLIIKGLIRNLNELSNSNQNGYLEVLKEDFQDALKIELDWSDPSAILEHFLKDWMEILSYINPTTSKFIPMFCEKIFNRIDSDKRLGVNFNDVIVEFEREEAEGIFRAYLEYLTDYVSIGKNQPHPKINYIQFEFRDLSSGEKVLLDIFARIHSVFSKFKDLLDTHTAFDSRLHVFLLMDEVEVGLHPDWQRRIINQIVQFINSYPKNQWLLYSIQVIFTTHSPLILSDFPKQQVVFIEREDNGPCKVINDKRHFFSFGANLNSILAQSFFLKENGFIGEFANSKISDCLAWLSWTNKIRALRTESVDSRKEEIEDLSIKIQNHPFYEMDKRNLDKYLLKIISFVDEPIISYKFKELLNLYLFQDD